MRGTTFALILILAVSGLAAVAAPASADHDLTCVDAERPCLSEIVCSDEMEATLGPHCGIPWP